MTVNISSSIGEDGVSNIQKWFIACRKWDSPASWLAPSTIPQISLYFEQRPLLNNESSGPLIWGTLQNRKKIMNTFGVGGVTTLESMQGATFVSWPLPSNTILVSKSLRVQETTRLCWGLYDSNYIICPICYCFIHVRIICFGFLCNVLGFVYAPWETGYTVCALDRLFIKCLRVLSSWLSNHDAQI